MFLPEMCSWFFSSLSWFPWSDPGGDKSPQNLSSIMSLMCDKTGEYCGCGCGRGGRGNPSDMASNILSSFLLLKNNNVSLFLSYYSSVFVNFVLCLLCLWTSGDTRVCVLCGQRATCYWR